MSQSHEKPGHAGSRRRKTRFEIERRFDCLEDRWVPAITVQIDYRFDSAGFFNDPARRQVLQMAADTVAGRLNDSLLAISPNAGLGNTWTATFNNPGSGQNATLTDLTIPANTYMLFAGAYDIPGSAIGLGGSGGFTVQGDGDFLNTVAARGQVGALSQPATDFGPWGGSLSVDLFTDWFFGINFDANAAAGRSDFLSVAMHEITHAFGFGASASWDRNIQGSRFAGPTSIAEFGGTVPLSGDLSHWAEGTLSGGQETAMDPAILTGTRVVLTPLDYAGLADIGWQVGASVLSWNQASGTLAFNDSAGRNNNLTIALLNVGGENFLQFSDPTGITASGDLGAGPGKLETIVQGQMYRVRVADLRSAVNVALGGGADAVNLQTVGLPLSIPLRIDGGLGSDTLTGDNAGRLYSISGFNTGSITGILPFGFTSVESLVGGGAPDTFQFLNFATLSGRIDGGGGADVLIGDNGNRTYFVSAGNAGSITSMLPSGFSSVENLFAGGASDTFVFANFASLSGRVDGGGGNNVLVGDNGNRSYFISGLNAGSITSLLPAGFANIGNLTGGGASDSFFFSNFAALTGRIDGGGNDDSLFGDSGNRTYFVSGAGVGSITSMLPAGFSNIRNLTGGGASDRFEFANFATLAGRIDGGGGNDTLVGDNGNRSYVITASNAGSISSMLPAGFSRVENLIGGGAADTFQFLAGGWLDGRIDGGTGGNTLIGDNVNRDYFISAPNAGSVTGILPFGFSNLSNVQAGAGDDTLVFGPAGFLSGTFDLGAGNNRVVGTNNRRPRSRPPTDVIDSLFSTPGFGEKG